jgi:hypothetical protein
MYQKTYAIDTTGLDQDQVIAFLSTVFEALGVHSRTVGRPPLLPARLAMKAPDAFRFVTGAPDEWLTTERQLFAEACFSITFGCGLSHAHQRWVNDAHWSPHNPRAHDDLANARIDLEFLDQFGMNMSGWDETFGTSGFLSRSAKNLDSAGDRIRVVIGLSMLGFSDPMQFFTRR